jgi:hypothetical protein
MKLFIGFLGVGSFSISCEGIMGNGFLSGIILAIVRIGTTVTVLWKLLGLNESN